jgi:hypothetical protein
MDYSEHRKLFNRYLIGSRAVNPRIDKNVFEKKVKLGQLESQKPVGIASEYKNV